MTWDDGLSDAIVGTDSGSIWGIRRNKEDLNGVPIIQKQICCEALKASGNGTCWQVQVVKMEQFVFGTDAWDILVLQADANEEACTSVAFSVRQ